MLSQKLPHRVTFGEMVETKGAGGVVSRDFVKRHECAAKMIYARGNETVEAARLEGRAIYKVKVISCMAARSVTSDWRMRDARSGEEYAITGVDAITDPEWVYVVVEQGNET
ncbi:head-tail adaptor protein [Thioclava sp. GXIMD2076]|uniref:phage head completion protein n=1 Tax=Thioclava sp. GXIMD2076 TaxID=3131931 RepID=UPI0030D310D5